MDAHLGHHLRRLAKYGFLEQVRGKDHRERPWRLVTTSYNWSAARAAAERSVAVDVLEQMTAERTIEASLTGSRDARSGRRHGGNTPA